MRPQVDDTTAEVVEQLADQLTEIDVDMLTFDQQLRVVLKQADDIDFSTKPGSNRNLSAEGRIIGQL